MAGKNPARNYAIEWVGKGARTDAEVAAVARSVVAAAAEPSGDPLGDVIDSVDALNPRFETDDIEDLEGVAWDAALEALVPTSLLFGVGGRPPTRIIPISGASADFDAASYGALDLTLTDDCDLTIIGGPPNDGRIATYALIVRQDTIGGHVLTISVPAGSTIDWIDLGTGLGGGAAPVVPTDPLAQLVIIVSTGNGGTDWGGSYPSTSAGASALDDLTDVAIPAPSAGDRLRYDGSVWANSPLFHHNVTAFDGTNWSVLFDGDGNCLYAEG